MHVQFLYPKFRDRKCHLQNAVLQETTGQYKAVQETNKQEKEKKKQQTSFWFISAQKRDRIWNSELMKAKDCVLLLN